jgi:hypothetical protein
MKSIKSLLRITLATICTLSAPNTLDAWVFAVHSFSSSGSELIGKRYWRARRMSAVKSSSSSASLFESNKNSESF